jgi:alpha-beta hydrolase superfamily lysophospholipase
MELKERKIKSRNIPIHLYIYESGKKRPSVIFIHGISLYGGAYINYIESNFLEMIAKENLNVVALDLEGHGKSGGKRGYFTFEGIIKDISEVVNYVVKNYNNQIALFGSSLGGILAFYSAIIIPQPKIVICHNLIDLKDIFSLLSFITKFSFLSNFKKLLPPLFKLLSWISLPINFLINENLLFENLEIIKKWKSDPLCTRKYRISSLISLFFTPENKPSLEEIEKPVRIITGEKDPVVPVEYVKKIYERLKCEKDLVIIPDAKHMIPLQYPSLTATLVVEWVKKYLK